MSSCALGGYALESKSVFLRIFCRSFLIHCTPTNVRCHLGKSIIYDTVTNASWAVDVRTHVIVAVIEKLLSEPWPPSQEIGREVPEPVAEDDCIVSRVLSHQYYSFL